MGDTISHGDSFDELLERSQDNKYQAAYTLPHPSTRDAWWIVTEAMPALLSKFLEKNRKYAEVEEGYALGDKGIIPDLNRKLGILVDRIWLNNPSVGEDTDEVIDDMIGHLLLLKAKRRPHADR